MEKTIINKRRVLMSTFFIPLAVPFAGFYLGLMDETEDFWNMLLMFATLGLLYGAIFWIPAMLTCLLIESLAIQEKTSLTVVLIILIGEAVAAWLVIGGMLSSGRLFGDEFSLILALSIASAQGLRILHLFYKNRIYSKAPKEALMDIIDDLN